MKRRSGFVSNSSSSSFIVISSNGSLILKDAYVGEDIVVDGYFGETEFGWEFCKYNSFGDRLIFAYLQTQYAQNNSWLKMLENVVKDHTGCKNIKWEVSLDYNSNGWAYIDHQSSASEGENIEMFDNEESLINFLFNENSYIQGGNDNV